MVKIELRNHDDSIEPAPQYASDADIALAQKLRHQLEQRYFGSSTEHAASEPWSGEVH